MITNLYQPIASKLAPDFMLTVKDSALDKNITDRIMSLSMTDNSGFEADTLDVTFDDSDGLIEWPSLGAEVKLALGWQGEALINCGSFIVDTVVYSGAPDILKITARSADFRQSLKNQMSDSYDDYTLGAIIGKISQRNNLDTAVLSKEMYDIKISHIDQTNETDMQFLTRLALLNGAQVTIKNRKILFFKSGSGKTASGESIPLMRIERADGDGHNFKLADRNKYDGVAATWLDTEQAKLQKIILQSKTENTKNTIPVHPDIKVGNAQEAPSTVEGTYLTPGAGKSIYTLQKVFKDRDSAVKAANSVLAQIQKGISTFSIALSAGRADLFTETPVEISGFKDVIDNQKWVITQVAHRVDATGFTTTLQLQVSIESLEYELN